jgi:glycolate oxidase
MNSGGAHCLKYGVTTNNLLGVKMVLMDGTLVDLGGPYLDAAGYDLLGLVCGSEGQLGIVTECGFSRGLRAPGPSCCRLKTVPTPARPLPQ